MKTYYKVVWSDAIAKSVSLSPPLKSLEIHYTLGREIVAPVGGLLVFDDLEQAKRHCWNATYTSLLKCTGWDPVPLPELCFTNLLRKGEKNLSPSQHDDMVRWICEELWRGVYHHDVALYGPWPTGTVAVKRLVPEEWIDSRTMFLFVGKGMNDEGVLQGGVV